MEAAVVGQVEMAAVEMEEQMVVAMEVGKVEEMAVVVPTVAPVAAVADFQEAAWPEELAAA